MKKIKDGFTLIELLIVIVMIGILAGGMIVIMNPVTQIQKSNDSKRKSDLAQIQRGLEMYYQDNGEYPTNSADFRIEDNSGTAIDWNSDWAPYMGIIPADPNSSQTYVYVQANSGQGYYLYASLERGAEDSQACTTIPCTNAPVSACGASTECSYGVSTPDLTP